MNIINSENYPSISVGLNMENSKSLSDNINTTSVGDNNLVNDSLKKSYSYLNLNYGVVT